MSEIDMPGKLARAIAADLMTMGGPKQVTAERIQLMKKQSDGTEKNLGGRNRDSVACTIQTHLTEAMCG
jgi:hypothetical protein